MSTKPSLNCPSRNDVDLALRQLEIEDEREKEAIRKFWERERKQEYREVTGRQLLNLFLAVIVLAAVGALLVWWAR